MAWCGDARAAEPLYDINVPETNAADALNRFAEQTGAILLFPYDLARTRQANTVRGRYTLLEGLQRLLKGTGLSGGLSDKRVVSISQTESARHPGEEGDMLKKKVSLGTKIAAFFTSILSVSAARGQNADAQVETLEEVIVTAQKREERLLDVPVPVTALSGESLTTNNQLRLQDYYSNVPGLNLQSGGKNDPSISIRGITADYGANPTVGVTIDDIPFGSSAGLGAGYTAPDLDASDMSRIEVLRGPQGTLYGASSLGGLLKFVTLDPSFDGFSGRIQAGVNDIRNGSEMGYSGRGNVNVPVNDVLAIRASGFYRRDPGYIDNIRTGEESVNSQRGYGGHLSALWRLSDALSLKLGALYQDNKWDGSSFVSVTPIDSLEQRRPRDTGWYEKKTQFYSAVLNGNVGDLEITSLSGYTHDEIADVLDFSASIPNSIVPETRETDKFSQEIRLRSTIGERFEWLVGAFYTDENSPTAQRIDSIDPVTSQPLATTLLVPFRVDFTEYAAFGDLTVKFTDRFDVQFGARESHIKQRFQQRVISVPTQTGTSVDGTSSNNAFTYMFTPRLKVSPDLMVYGRVASGYRTGGPNSAVLTPGVAPAEYKSDRTVNYEIGVKGDALEGALRFDASIYYIVWRDIQLSARSGSLSYFDNGGRAKSEGIELSVDSRPWAGMTLGGWVAYNNAELTENFPSTSTLSGRSGAQLPGSSKRSAHLYATQDFPITSALTGYVGAAWTYVGERLSYFRAVNVARDVYPSYRQIDARAGVKQGTWSIDLFGRNLGDERGVLNIRPQSDGRGYQVIPPRMIGLSFSKDF